MAPSHACPSAALPYQAEQVELGANSGEPATSVPSEPTSPCGQSQFLSLSDPLLTEWGQQSLASG